MAILLRCLILAWLWMSASFAQVSTKRPEPEILQNVKLLKFIQVPFRLICHIEEINGKKKLFSGRARAPLTGAADPDSHPIEIGDRIPGTEFRLTRITPRTGVGALGTEIDLTELEMKNSTTGEAHILTVGVMANDPVSYAVLESAGKEFKVRKGDTFTLSLSADVVWLLTDINNREALLKQEGTGKLARIVASK